MLVERVEEEFPFPLDRLVRPSGLHVGRIIHDIIYESGMFNFRQKNNNDNDDTSKYMQFTKGFLWEEVLSLAFGNRHVRRPPAICVDNIWCSPDGVSTGADGVMQLEEYKCTVKSCDKDFAENVAWVMQVKAYCYAMNLRRVVFRVLHLVGNRKNNWIPTYAVYHLEFTPQELNENWQMLLNHAQRKGMFGNDTFEESYEEN